MGLRGRCTQCVCNRLRLCVSVHKVADHEGLGLELHMHRERASACPLHSPACNSLHLHPNLLCPCSQSPQANAELSSAERTLSNAWGMYSRTRPAPSTQSVRRTRALPKEGVHPLLLALLPRSKYTSVANEAALAQFTERLKSFRPAATVLEADISRVRSTFTNPMLEAVSGAETD